MRVVIMQPTYLPWMGYFDLIDQSDIFIFLDDVQFSRQSWQQRNKIKAKGGEQWLTVPVLRNFPQLIKDVCINNVTDWRASHWKAITYNYQKSGYLEKYKTLFENIYMNRWEKLRDLNIEFIRAICLCLGLKKKFMYSSELAATGEKVERLINICKKVNADTYLSPAGSYDYIEENNMFKDSGINLIYHDYSFSTYRQLYGEFISHLSVIDLLFNEGDKALEVIRSNRKN